MVKATSLASIITLMEITGIARAISSETYRPFEVFACAGALYLLINFMLVRMIGLLERGLNNPRHQPPQVRLRSCAVMADHLRRRDAAQPPADG